MQVRAKMMAGVTGLMVTGLLAAPARAGDTTPTTTPSLEAQIQHLQAELDALKQQQQQLAPRDQSTPTAATAAAASTPDTTASAVESDAAKRGATPLMDVSGLTAGYIHNKGFVINSEDGNFLLHPWIYIQPRYAVNYRENAKNGTESSTDAGFEIARLKLIFDGNVFSPDLTYQFVWNTVKSGGNLSMNDAWARYHFRDTPFAVQGGQIRNPLDHEQIMFATQTMTVDRSIVDDVFANGEGIVQGVAVSYGYDQPGALRAQAAFTHGLRNNNTSFQDFPTTNANWGAAARVEWKLMGDWKGYDHFTSLGTRSDLLVLGAAADYTEAGDTGALLHVVDAQYTLPSGLSVYAAYLGRYAKNNAGPPGTNGGSTSFAPQPDTYDATARIMVSYLFNDRFEPYVRYEYIQFDPKGLPSTVASNTVHDITVGANYYFYGQRAKISANVIYLPNGMPINDNTVNDILANPAGGNQVVFQTQFQLIL